MLCQKCRVLWTSSVSVDYFTQLGRRYARTSTRDRRKVKSFGAQSRFTLAKKVADRNMKSPESLPPSAGPLNSDNFGVLSAYSYADRLKNKKVADKIATFESLKILPSIREALYSKVLGHLTEKKPSDIQTLAIHQLQKKRKNKNEMRRFLIAAETGSGKTLAYLIPLVHQLKETEGEQVEEYTEGFNSRPSTTSTLDSDIQTDDERPGPPLVEAIDYKERASDFDAHREILSSFEPVSKTDMTIQDLPPHIRSVILVPTFELVEQVLKTVKQLSHVVKFSSTVLDTTPRKIHNLLRRRWDILVTTPAKFNSVYDRTPKFRDMVRHCSHVVVDEADTLLDRSFEELTMGVLERTNQATTVVFCSATIPHHFDKYLRKNYPDLIRVVAPHLHQVPRRITFQTIDASEMPYRNNKKKALLQILHDIYYGVAGDGYRKNVVIFRNKVEDIDPLVDFLAKERVNVERISGEALASKRAEILSSYTERQPLDPEDPDNKEMKVLVASDIISRGVDLAGVRFLILYDVPKTSIDMLHRLGRIGRFGKRGRAYLIVDKDDKKPWVMGLHKIIQKGLALS